MVPESVIAKARSMLEASTKPLFLHDDDCDGTTSFVICYQFCKSQKGDGTGVPIKRSPSVGIEYLRKVDEARPDLVVILDKPRVDHDFLAGLHVPVLWIDHHEPQLETVRPFGNVFYLNPRIWDDNDNRPTSYWSYIITKTNLWMATVGSVGDWFLPEYIKECKEAYPELVPKDYEKLEDVYIDSPIGTLVRVIQFNLKGIPADAKKGILTLTRIESPYEILHQTSSRGKFLWKKYERLAAQYDVMLQAAMEAAEHSGKILLYLYSDEETAFSTELSNELLIRYPERVAYIIGRRHDGRIKASIRSHGMDMPPLLDESLRGLDGHGGGHRRACGMSIAEKDWDVFWGRFSKLVEEKSLEK
jgi:single-stranded DNA-specific DHH superfamily exonuclease